MIIGIGIDIVELERIEEVMNRQPRFVERVLTVNERKTFETYSKKRKIEFLAGRFAAKEAFVKATGTGISKNYSWHDIEIIKEDSGKPNLVVPGLLGHTHLSISHSRNYAVAEVIIESLSS
ncbi:holo-ACP synthase [Halalkalibacter okhensis]|uniref:Holo-[acyl-carrier-protein] synthase n=1 Tax=Halalkalibacter okhensis TaxID=333138 RepID=A0A0B0IG78_9BACI|nr:holo-ACP synthase [Halalkalibacter okhensis]KHF39074.1 4'-phosphopantetheinyl transferase [Halalkalibacter okhensis]